MTSDLLNMQGTVTLVTGAAGGIGSAVAKIISRHGGQCVLHDSCSISSDEAAYCHTGSTVLMLQGDLSNPSECERIFRRLDDLSITVDRLVNCTGIYIRRPVSSLDLAMMERTFAINTFAPFHLTKLLAERLLNGKIEGRVVNVASDAWLKGPSKGAHYAASKAALVAMTRSLARALGPRSITVNSVSPGVTRTHQPQLDDSQFLEGGKKIPLGRIAEPEDVANVILFLLSPMGSYVNGHDLMVNGGSLTR